MKVEYEYNDRQYEVAVQSLKSTFFDIFSLHQKNLRGLKNAIDVTEGEQQVALIRQFNMQKLQLDEMLKLVSNIIESVQIMDSCSQYGDKENTVGSLQEDVAINNNDLSSENGDNVTVAMNDFEPDNISIENNITDTDNNVDSNVSDVSFNTATPILEKVPMESDVAVQEESVVKDTPKINFVTPNIPTIAGSDEKKDGLEDESGVVATVVPTEEHDGSVISAVPGMDNTDGIDANVLSEDSSVIPQEANLSQILSPIDDVLPAKVVEDSNDGDESGLVSSGAQDNDKLSTEGESNYLSDEAQKDVLSSTVLSSIQTDDKNETFIRASDEVVKAILVTDKQYNNLLASRDTQTPLFRGLVNAKNNVEVNLKNNQSDGDIAQQQATIEKMMEEANVLYKEGKAEEAQKMYDKISAMNKQLQSQAVGGVSLVKK